MCLYIHIKLSVYILICIYMTLPYVNSFHPETTLPPDSH